MPNPDTVQCWKCGREVALPSSGKVGFRMECDHCGSWLHACKGCQFYKPGLPNSCRRPDTEYVADREAANFCDEFAPLGESVAASESAADAAKRLFGDEEDDDLKPPSIDSLFKD